MNNFDRLPIRSRLAVISGGLTLAILAVFAIVLGILATRELRSDFDDDLRATAADLERSLRPGAGSDATREALELVAAGDAAIRVVDGRGRELRATPQSPNLGPPQGEVVQVGDYRVASVPISSAPLADTLAFLQYAKPVDDLDASLARIRLFLLLGVLAGAGLALLAGHTVAGRAMAPITGLTNAAREVARTRDPDVTLPKPDADDEVADLARTLEEMLSALAEARRDTESALTRQREFVADASHELRTPLTSVLANLELLEDELGRGEAGELATSALRSTRRMRRLVADLLLLARADAGRPSQRRAVDLAEVVTGAVAEAAALAGGHEVEVGVEPDLVVEAAPDDLHRLVLNLVENALRHTPAGTRVAVTGTRETPGVLLLVEDDGPGIREEERPRIFDRFARLGGDGGGGGSGLGLAIVRAVAESHGGSVAVASGAGGRGARFEVRLPAAAVPAPAPPRAQAS